MLVTLAGYVALVVVVGRLLAYLSKYVKSPVKVKSLGDWALVTGATDGIGKFLSSSLLLQELLMLRCSHNNATNTPLQVVNSTIPQLLSLLQMPGRAPAHVP